MFLPTFQFSGPTIQEVICNTDSDQSITVVVTNAQGYFVYVVGCSSSQGEYGGSGVPSANEQVTISDCGIQWVSALSMPQL